MRQSEKYWMKCRYWLCAFVCHMPHTLSTLFQDQVSEFDCIYNGGQLLFNFFFPLPYQNFACPVLKSKYTMKWKYSKM